MARWLLCDYGEVLSLPPTTAGVGAVAAAAGWDPRDLDGFWTAYWAGRRPYDRGDTTAAEYWAALTGRPLTATALAEVTRADAAMWLLPNTETLAAAARAADRGLRLAILSNAPVEVAEAIRAADWVAPFSPKFFSCYLRATKPEPVIYEAVLAELGARPEDVTFFDDRPPNVVAASALGIDARIFESAGQLDDVNAATR